MEMPRLVKKMVFHLFARRFVAGETIDDAIKKAKELKAKNIYAIINILGEHVKDEKEAGKFFYQYLQLISKLRAQGLDGVHIAIKPSQLGIEVSHYLFGRYMTIILKQANLCLPNSLIEIDRETREYAKSVREVSLVLARNFSNLRVVCQINLDETIQEIQQFIGAGISIRLCKGTAYLGDIKKEKEIRQRYLEQAILLSEKGNRPAIATHDLYLIDRLKEKKNLEFQVLLGIENREMAKLVSAERKVGFYVPCGPNWWPYGKRRGKAILKIWLRNFFYRAGEAFAESFEKIGEEARYE